MSGDWICKQSEGIGCEISKAAITVPRSLALRFSIIALVVSVLLLISAVAGAINFDCWILLNVAIELCARR
ncbi:hypothetical protein QT995_16680 [Microcoleus sp. S36b_A3]|uniref:hypothetical protein n=1 Tax=unclassified Microcoleus TaxID=2642155 RepID=UPI002FD744AA